MGAVVGPVDINKFLELNSHACKRAFSRLWVTGKGRYAYADDWNVLADCIQNVFDTIDDMYRNWGDLAMFNPHNIFAQRMFERIRRLYMETFECRRAFADYRRLQWGDIVTPEHTNVLIDTAKCLDDAMERIPRRGEVVLVDPDDWGTASGLIEDGTIVFVNFGTKAMSPVEVQYFLEKYNVVFAILIDTRVGDTGAFYNVFYNKPYIGSWVAIERSFRLRRGAFFDSFGVYGCHQPRGPDMPVGHMFAYWDFMTQGLDKIPTVVRWTWQYGITYKHQRTHLGGLDIPVNMCLHVSNGIQPGEGRVIANLNGVNVPLETLQAFAIAYLDRIVTLCHGSADLEQRFRERLEIEFESRQGIGADILHGWGYARIGKGAVIELPFDGLIEYDNTFDWYIGAIAHVLLGEPDKCHIGPLPLKLRRIVWMAKYNRESRAFNEWEFILASRAALDRLRSWSSRSKWRIIDLRTKR